MTMRPPRRPSRAAIGEAAARLSDPLHRLRNRLAAQPQLRLLLAIWNRLLDEAGDLVAPLVARFAGDARLVAVPRRTGGLDLFVVKHGIVTQVETPPADAALQARVELRLRADQMIERILTLPASSRDYLDTIIDHRIERLVPWRRDAVLHGYEVQADADAGSSIVVRVLLTSADILAGPRADLAALGLAPAATGGDADRIAESPRIAFGRGTAALRPAWQRKAGRAWLAVTATLCLLAVATSTMASMEEDRRIEAERHLTKARRLIREATDAASPDAIPLLSDKKPERSTMVLIDRLAAAIPDTSYLRELAVTPADVRLVGSASDAPALIPLIEKAGFFNVRFTGPVSHGDDKRDEFEITADRAPRKDPP